MAVVVSVKTCSQNLRLLTKLGELTTFRLPILVGVSRKLFIGELLQVPVEDRLYGSLAAAVDSGEQRCGDYPCS